MTTAKKTIDDLPEAVRSRLTEWAASLKTTLGDDLVGVVVHGSVARGEYRPGESDVDAVVVLKDASFANLDAIANATQLARASARVEAMILTEDEIAGASDCFPLLYDEIRGHHVVVTGRDPFAGVVVHDTHRRLRIEQELREAQIRMRRAVTDATGGAASLTGVLARKLKQVRSPLRALLQLKGVTCSHELATVLARASETWKVDAAALSAVRERPADAHAALTALLKRAIDDVDAHRS